MAATVLQMRMASSEESCTCCNCGVEFYSPVIAVRHKDGRSFHCPNGHVQAFVQSEAAKLRVELATERARREQAERDAEWQLQMVKIARTQQTKAQNKLKKIETRVNAGVCPHCNRTFKQLAAHMKCKHAGTIAAPNVETGGGNG